MGYVFKLEATWHFRSLDAGLVLGLCRWAGALGEFQISIVPCDLITYIKTSCLLAALHSDGYVPQAS
jgi:hypothetical protein